MWPPPLANQPTQYAYSQQQTHQQDDRVPRPMPPSDGGSKRKAAFICGINYLGSRSQLNGCINDAKCMEYLLIHRFGFKQENILLFTDDHPDPLRRPTRYNIYQGFQWLMSNVKQGDSLVFHYSGHGAQKRDYTGEELDGMNETLLPLDHQVAGEIVDDELNRMLVNPLPQGAKLHAIIDACHSGSVMDLPFTASSRGGYPTWESQYAHPVIAQRKGTAGGFCVQFGASRDHQTAADTRAMSGYVSTGAATFSFIRAIENKGLNLTYGELLMAMHYSLSSLNGGGGGGGGAPAMMGGLDGLLGGLLGGSMSGYRGQEPVMSANYAFDLNFKFNL